MEKFSVSEFIAYCNQTLEYAYTGCTVEGEVSEMKTSQGKWVFFSLKDDEGSIDCFIPIWQLRVPIEDGMKVVVRGTPKLTNWGKFSFTVQAIQPVGQGNIKKSFELLKKKLEKEGLFNPAKKRPLPRDLSKIGVISSTQAAGYADFIKIVNERWGGLELQVCHTQVQGLVAPDQIIRALNYLNERAEVEVIAIIRGGGSADDLACFNDEKLVRAIAASKIPVITGIGHEIDESLSDLAADVVASTPSNAAQMLTHDKKAEIKNLHDNISRIYTQISSRIDLLSNDARMKTLSIASKIYSDIESKLSATINLEKVLEGLNPDNILKNGYAIVTGKVEIGSEIEIETYRSKINANITNIKEKK
jgi:exodeoxyribonuclease VII large subunit